MNSVYRWMLLGLLTFTTHQSLGQEEGQESFTHWDQIVRELRSNVDEPEAPIYEEHGYSMDDVQIALGAGLSFTYLNLGSNSQFAGAGLLKGFGVQFGIDLFHPEFQAEGAFRNYASENISETLNAQVREFELRLVHSRRLPHSIRFRLGAGLSARYLNLHQRGLNGSESLEASVPSGTLLIGVGRTFGRNLFIGPDINYRSPMSGGNIEQASVDFHLRANALF